MGFDSGITAGIKENSVLENKLNPLNPFFFVLERYGQRFLNRVFTPGEIAYCRGRAPNLAARFAAKEATMKALGTGIRGVGWKDIEVVRHESGAPAIKLHQRGETRAQRRGVQEISLSLSHSREYAVAFVVIRSESPG